jgi:hypothetical protein
MRKSVKAWAIKYRGKIMPWTTADTRKELISVSWWTEQDAKVVRVEIRELKPKRKKK